jgi:hypothetical protein
MANKAPPGTGSAAGHRYSRGRIAEHFFFDAVIVGAGLAAEAPDIVQRLIAIPARSLGLERRHRGSPDNLDPTGRVALFLVVVRIMHDSAALLLTTVAVVPISIQYSLIGKACSRCLKISFSLPPPATGRRNAPSLRHEKLDVSLMNFWRGICVKPSC